MSKSKKTLHKRIKICGLTRPEDIAAVNEYRPDYIGFVFAPSKRNVSEMRAAGLKKLLSPDITAVGVFVNSPIADIVRLVSRGDYRRGSAPWRYGRL